MSEQPQGPGWWQASDGKWYAPQPTHAPQTQQQSTQQPAADQPQHTPKKRKKLGFLPDWRVFTYVILAFNLLMLVWIISGAASAGGEATDCGTLDQETCEAAEAVGTGIGVVILFVFWVLGDIILGILWLVTNRSKRTCPACGSSVKKGLFQCSNCGHDFRGQQYQPQVAGGSGYGGPPAGQSGPPGWGPKP